MLFSCVCSLGNSSPPTEGVESAAMLPTVAMSVEAGAQVRAIAGGSGTSFSHISHAVCFALFQPPDSCG
jgi:hypothetical protein